MTVPDRRQWLTPGFLKEVVVAVLMIGGTIWTIQSKVDVLRKDNDRLETQLAEQGRKYERGMEALENKIEGLQQAQADVIRAQERMAALVVRIEALEKFQAEQNLYNQRYLISLSELKRSKG